jgi:hypothetical protein
MRNRAASAQFTNHAAFPLVPLASSSHNHGVDGEFMFGTPGVGPGDTFGSKPMYVPDASFTDMLHGPIDDNVTTENHVSTL